MSDDARTLLATFRNVSDPDRADRAAEDMAAVTGLSVRQTSIDLAKALIDPTEPRLSKFYIEIDGVAYSGNTDDIQGDILTAIEKQVGGAGDRYRQMTELNRALSELVLRLREGLRIDQLVHWLNRQINRVTRK